MQLVERYHFIHNVFANFFKDALDFFSTCIYPRFEYRVVGTYDKAVEYLQKKQQYKRETDKPMLPALILSPIGEFLPADTNAGGKQYWRYPNLAPGLAKRLFDPVYQDKNLIINVAFLRIKGEMELIMLLNSFYEYCDLKLLFLNTFGGLERIIYPIYFSSFIILPDSLASYIYTNDQTGKTYSLDWSTAGAYQKLVPTTAENELVIPVHIRPQLTLTSLADASEKYGGTDNIADWRLRATIGYEVEVPNYLVLESDYLLENINLEIRCGSTYSVNNDYQEPPPDNRIVVSSSWDWNLNEDTNSDVDYLDPDDATSSTTITEYEYHHRYFHIITAEEAATCDSTSDIEISLPEQITNEKLLIVNSKYGQLDYGDHYYLKDDGWTLVIRTGSESVSIRNTCPPEITKTQYIHVEEGWVLELYVYKLVS